MEIALKSDIEVILRCSAAGIVIDYWEHLDWLVLAWGLSWGAMKLSDGNVVVWRLPDSCGFGRPRFLSGHRLETSFSCHMGLSIGCLGVLKSEQLASREWDIQEMERKKSKMEFIVFDNLILEGVTVRLHFHFSLSCIGEGNGNPLQCSCLENHRDGWAAISGVAQSRTRLKRFSSSSSTHLISEGVTEPKLIMLVTQQANKLKDKLLSQGRAAFFGKPEDWEDGGLTSQELLPELQLRLLWY